MNTYTQRVTRTLDSLVLRQHPTDLLSCKMLAVALGRHVNYVYVMRRLGFPMPGGRATLASAVDWLSRHPYPRGNGRKR